MALSDGCLEQETFEDQLNLGSDVNLQDSEGYTALHRAVQRKLYKAARLLLSSGASPNLPDSSGCTPVHYAIAQKDAHMLELLLKYKADLTLYPYLQLANEQTDELCTHLLRMHSPIKTPHKLTQQELTQGKFFYWLERNGLAEYYDKLLDAGFDSLEALIEKAKGPLPVTTQDLEQIGFTRVGHRYKFLIRLDEEAGITKPVKRLAVYTEAEGCCTSDFVECSLKAWLQAKGLDEIEDALQAAAYDLELVLLQGQSAYGFSPYILKSEVGIRGNALRATFLEHLRETLAKRTVDAFYLPKQKKCQNCTLL